MIVVSDTSVLIHLAEIDRFSLLRRLYTEVTIPTAVWRETVVEGGGRPGAPETRSAHTSGWIEVAAPAADTDTYRQLREALDAGEAEALALADQLQADLVLLDESAARQWAEELEIPKTGTVGVLLRAKREGLIDAVRPALNALRKTAFWIDDSLYRHALDAANERPK